MKTNFKHITTALAVCTGLMGTVASADAQTTTPRGSSSSASQAGTSGASSQSMSKMDDQAFAQKAMEANMAEIMMAKLALQKGASAKVKEFAQMMIDEHGSANDQLKAIVSGVAMSGPEQMGTGTATTGGAMGNTGATGSSTTGSTTGATTTASGATSPGSTDHSATGHSGSHANTGATGTTGSGNTSVGASGTTGTSGNNAPEQMGTGTAGSTGTMGASGSGATTGATTSPSGATSPGSVNSGTMGHAGSHATMGTGSADFDDPTMLSPEHRTMMDKLSKLTGPAFDREYIQGQIKDHAKTAALFESQMKNGQDARLKEFATTLLPSIRKHGQMASDIANSMRSGSSRSGGSSGQ